jgi:flavin-binding protein dodecin
LVIALWRLIRQAFQRAIEVLDVLVWARVAHVAE